MAMSACAAPAGTVAVAPAKDDPFASSLAPAPSAPPGACPASSEMACLMETIWEASAALPDKKRDRLAPLFRDTVAGLADPALRKTWARRLGPGAGRADMPSFGKERAEAVLRETDWNGFRERARRAAPPFNLGRPEIMAAGVHLAPDQATARAIINDMFDLARPKTTRGGMGDTFEMGDFGHALAELSMQRCDLASFDRALSLTPEPDAIRYRLWRARITGHAGHLAPVIRDGATDEDTRHVRNALEGLAPIIRLGYCDGKN